MVIFKVKELFMEDSGGGVVCLLYLVRFSNIFYCFHNQGGVFEVVDLSNCAYLFLFR